MASSSSASSRSLTDNSVDTASEDEKVSIFFGSGLGLSQFGVNRVWLECAALPSGMASVLGRQLQLSFLLALIVA